MNATVAFVLGLFLGVCGGVFILALMTASKLADTAARSYLAGQNAERERRRREDLGIIDLAQLRAEARPAVHFHRGA